ncbi:hypothetical protein [Nonomuraea soli]|uniref:Uncharacterized protein n=1 Tax=Nonomuraea soli TaxID=1032476 RepID=A0A7W0CV24_9ACTN|nr:hypothetical protein [Nonomuraea soli]MBA2897780.1 hypothetical protein [Nonomuraea soli]
MAKIRKQEQGHRYAEQMLCSFGAAPRRPGQDPRCWLEEALAAAQVRAVRHLGNHRFAWTIGPRRLRSRITIAVTGLAAR